MEEKERYCLLSKAFEKLNQMGSGQAKARIVQYITKKIGQELGGVEKVSDELGYNVKGGATTVKNVMKSLKDAKMLSDNRKYKVFSLEDKDISDNCVWRGEAIEAIIEEGIVGTRTVEATKFLISNKGDLKGTIREVGENFGGVSTMSKTGKVLKKHGLLKKDKEKEEFKLFSKVMNKIV